MKNEQAYITGLNVISLHDYMVELDRVEAALAKKEKLSDKIRDQLSTRQMKLQKMVEHLASA